VRGIFATQLTKTLQTFTERKKERKKERILQEERERAVLDKLCGRKKIAGEKG
jgi:hypothetical protein